MTTADLTDCSKKATFHVSNDACSYDMNQRVRNDFHRFVCGKNGGETRTIKVEFSLNFSFASLLPFFRSFISPRRIIVEILCLAKKSLTATLNFNALTQWGNFPT